MNRLLFISICLGFFAFSCADNFEGSGKTPVDNRTKSQIIIDSAIYYHGGENYYNSEIAFGFRDRFYKIDRSANTFTYSTQFTDSLGNHFRELTNDGFAERINNEQVVLSAKDSMAFAESLNSVVYFALLPSFLHDDAVNSTLDGEDEIDGKEYYRVRVSFDEEGGGEDFDDIYLYWFDKSDFSMDYLAYSFHVNKGGSRFRVATNSRRVNGILFQDYTNLKGPGPDSLDYIFNMYKSGQLPVLSQIELNRLSVVESSTVVTDLN